MIERFSKVLNLKRFKAIEKMRGTQGIYDSHRAVIQGLSDSKEGITVIMEDDIVPCLDFEKKLDSFISELPEDWDIFMVGFFSTERSTIEMVTEHIYKAKDRICAWHCYIVNPKSYEKLLTEFDKIEENDYNADVLLLRFQKTNNVYVAIPSLCYQDGSASDNDMGSTEIVSKATKRFFQLY
jgi:GR25 family glycosyltransferase involved in LPS biosynthesis